MSERETIRRYLNDDEITDAATKVGSDWRERDDRAMPRRSERRRERRITDAAESSLPRATF